MKRLILPLCLVLVLLFAGPGYALTIFDNYGPDARAVLEDLLDKYTEYGVAEFSLPDVLKGPPISDRGNVAEIIQLFGGAENLRNAVNELQQQLYAA